MKFHGFETLWDRVGSEVRKRFKGNYVDFYDASANMALASGHLRDAVINIGCEAEWIKNGRPYYKLWPSYAVMLSKTRLDIPTEILKLPFTSFGILLPRETGLFVFEHNGRRQKILSMLVRKYKPYLDANTLLPHGHPEQFIVLVDDSESDATSHTCMNLEKPTIEECFESCEDAGDTSIEMLKTSVRIAVATSLLAISAHRAVEHDVIAELRGRYDAAQNDAQREALFEKSKRRGVHGYRIGRGRELSLATPPPSDSFGTGRELSYQHIRGGHFHTVAHGPGHSLRKVMFFEPTIVRPDLPVPPLEAVT